MKAINCDYCEKMIKSKDDLLLGTHFFNIPTAYHDKCFDEAKEKQGFFKKPVMKVLPSKFKFYTVVNMVNIIVGALLLVFSDKLSTYFPQIYPKYSIILIGIFLIFIGSTMLFGLNKYNN